MSTFLPARVLRRRFAIPIAWCAFAVVQPLALPAQTAAPPVPSGDAVVLGPFTVSSAGDTGYLALNSLSGSRLNTSLADLAVPTTAFTADFLQDTAVRSVEELAGYMTSTQISYPEANQAFFTGDSAVLQIRGLPASTYAVNYFATTLRLDLYNTGRVDQSRGANSILFGLGSPGGVVNVSTSRAVLGRSAGALTVQARSNNGLRSTLDYNVPLIRNRLALRIDAVRDHGDTWRNHEYDHQDRLYLTVRGGITSRTMVDAEFEHGVVNKSIGSPSTAADLYTRWQAGGNRLSAAANAAAGIKVISTNNYVVVDTATGIAADWRNKTDTVANTIDGTQVYTWDFSLIPAEAALGAGPAFPQKTNYQRGSLVLTHSFSADLHVELAANHQDAPRDTINGSSFVSLRADPNPTLPNGQPNPNAGRAYSEGFPVRNIFTDRASALRLSASYAKNLGRILGRHEFAVLAEKNWTKSGNLQMRLADLTDPFNPASPENAANLLVFRTYLDLRGPADQLVAGDWRPVEGRTITETVSGRRLGIDWVNAAGGSALNRFELETAMAVLQSRFLNDRLITVVGLRENWQDSWYSPTNVRGPATPLFRSGPFIIIPGTDATSLRAHTATTSGLLRLTRRLALTYNWASDFALPSTTGSTPSGRVPPPEGRSRDVGLKFNDGNRLSLNVAYFETSAKKNYSAATTLPSNPDALINTIWSSLGAASVRTADGRSAGDVQVLSNGYTFDAVTRGCELELIANPTPQWRLFATYSYNKSTNTALGLESRAYVAQNRAFWLQGTNGRVLLDGSGRLAPVANDGTSVVDTVAKAVTRIEQLHSDYYVLGDGQRPRGQIPDKGSVRANYAFAGETLKGFGVGAGLRYTGAPITAYAQSTGTTPSAVRYGPKLALVDANLSYRRPIILLGRSLTWFVQLNADNLLDNRTIVPMRVSLSGDTITYRLQPPRRLSLLTRLSF